MNFETFQLLRDAVKRLVNERLIPKQDRVEREDAALPEIIQEMRDLGLFGLSVPEEFDGLGLTMAVRQSIIPSTPVSACL